MQILGKQICGRMVSSVIPRLLSSQVPVSTWAHPVAVHFFLRKRGRRKRAALDDLIVKRNLGGFKHRKPTRPEFFWETMAQTGSHQVVGVSERMASISMGPRRSLQRVCRTDFNASRVSVLIVGRPNPWPSWMKSGLGDERSMPRY